MRWGLVLSLSMFGLAMALGTVAVIPARLGGPLWIAIFIITSIIIAKRADGRFFLHGFVVGLVNWAWVTASHVVFHATYVAHHASDIATRQAYTLPAMPAPIAAIIGPAFAFLQTYDAPIPGLSAIIYGTLSWAGAKWLRRGSGVRPSSVGQAAG
jgi:hypothetical protein